MADDESVPLVTERLVLRDYTLDDLDALHALRNDPDVARYQDWPTPYPRESAQRLIEECAAIGTPAPGEWYHLAVADRVTGAYVGDLPLNRHGRFPTAEIGYSFATTYQRRGLATEAATRVIEWLFDTHGLRRIEAFLHPDNVASARLLERLGFLFEGTKRLAFGPHEDPSDDACYGLLRDDWEAWKARPRHEPVDVALVEVDADNLGAARAVAIHRTQEAHGPTAERALLDAYAPGGSRWCRAVVADGSVVGLVTAGPVERGVAALLVDRMHQGRGIEARARALAVAALGEMTDRGAMPTRGEMS